MKLTSQSRNIIFIYFGDAASRLLGLAAISYLARILGPSDFGIISIGLAALAYVLVIGNSGLKILGTRKVAGEQESIEVLTPRIILTQLLLSAAAFGIGTGINYFFIDESDIFRVTLVYLLGVFPTAFLLEWFFQGRQKLGIMAAGKIIGMIFYLGMVLILVKSSRDLIWVAWAWIIGIGANSIFLWIVFKAKYYSSSFQKKQLKIISLLREALPLGAATIIAQLTTQFPPLYLGLVAGTSQVGLFSAAFKVIVFLLILDRTFYAIFFPLISRCFHKFPEKLEENVNLVLRITTVLVLIVGLYAVVSGEFIIRGIFGVSFLGAVPIFQVLVGYFIFNVINSVFTFSLIGMEKEKVYTVSLLAGMIAFILFLLLFTEALGTFSVAGGLIIYQLTALVIMAAALKNQIHLNYIRTLLLPLLGTCLLVIPLLLYIHLIFYIKIMFITFIGIPYILWLGGIGKNEVYFLKRKFI
ncbi:MAG: oligosaccharide flippase family protein [bacterium]